MFVNDPLLVINDPLVDIDLIGENPSYLLLLLLPILIWLYLFSCLVLWWPWWILILLELLLLVNFLIFKLLVLLIDVSFGFNIEPGGGWGGANELIDIWVGVLQVEFNPLVDSWVRLFLLENNEYCEVAEGGVTGTIDWGWLFNVNDEFDEKALGDLGVNNWLFPSLPLPS